MLLCSLLFPIHHAIEPCTKGTITYPQSAFYSLHAYRASFALLYLKTELIPTNTSRVRINIAVEAQIYGVRLASTLELLNRLLRHCCHLFIIAFVPLSLVLYPTHVVTSSHRIALHHHHSPSFPPYGTRFPSARKIQQSQPASPSLP